MCRYRKPEVKQMEVVLRVGDVQSTSESHFWVLISHLTRPECQRMLCKSLIGRPSARRSLVRSSWSLTIVHGRTDPSPEHSAPSAPRPATDDSTSCPCPSPISRQSSTQRLDVCPRHPPAIVLVLRSGDIPGRGTCKSQRKSTSETTRSTAQRPS